jgi:hypothetical protein
MNTTKTFINNIIIPIITFLTLVSCKNEKKEYYENGNIKSIINYNSNNKKNGESIEFYPNGAIKEKRRFRDGYLIDSISKFDKNGFLNTSIHFTRDSTLNFVKTYDSLLKLESKGYIQKGKKIGEWKYFKNGKLIGEDHFFNVGNRTVKLNQQKIIENGQIIDSKSFYYNMKIKDTVAIGDVNQFSVTYNFRPDSLKYGENKFIFLLVSDKINKYFSNVNNVKMDTFIPINQGKINGKFILQSKGVNYLRGTIEEHNIIEEKGANRIEIIKMYFEKKIFVRDSIPERGTYKISENI